MDGKNSQPSRSPQDGELSETPVNWENFVKELKIQWRTMWHDRIDDRMRAEGIAKKDYPLLFLDSGTIVVATRKYKPPDFFEILKRHQGTIETKRKLGSINAFVGGMGRFIRVVLKKQPRYTMRKRPETLQSKGKEALQKKKGGRGWIHRF